MAKSEKRPSWFKLFLHQKPLIDSVPDDIVGKALKAALRYFDTREESELEPLSMAVFCTIKPYIDEAFADYDRDVKNGQKGGRPPKPTVTPYNPGIPTPTQAEADVEADAETGKEAIRDKADKPPTRPRFTPPTVDQVRAYCAEKGYAVDADRFVDYYTSNGWRVGKNPMKDWKAAVRTWNGKDKTGGKTEHKPLWTIGTTV